MRRGLRGFTLVEILVVVSLLSVVMLALGAALRTFAQTEARLDQRLARSDELRVAEGFIRSTLGRMSARKPEPGAQPADRKVLLSAEPNAIAWIGVMPARYGAGGLTFFRLAVEASAAGSDLVIRFQPCGDAARFPVWAEVPSRVLVSGVTAFDIAYQDARKAAPVWSASGAAMQRLPDRLRVSIHTAERRWPEIVVPIRVLPMPGDSSDGFTVGGST